MPGTVLAVPKREEIWWELVDDETFIDIGGRIGRHASPMSREVVRHGTPTTTGPPGPRGRTGARRRPKPRKLVTRGRMRGQVEARIQSKPWPEQIANREHGRGLPVLVQVPTRCCVSPCHPRCFTDLYQDRLDEIFDELNRRPRETLEWMTPSEKFTEFASRGHCTHRLSATG